MAETPQANVARNGANTSQSNHAQLATTDPNAITPTETQEDDSSGGISFGRVVMFAVGGMIGFVLLLFLLGLLFILSDAAYWQPIVAVIRDITLTIFAVQGILIITGVALTALQLARFINLLGSEVKPMTRDAREALRSVRHTADFARKHGGEPLVQTQSFLAGLVVFVRELLRLNRLLRRRSDRNAE